MLNATGKLKLSEILQQEVLNNDGQSLGRVKDVIIETQSGRVEWIRLMFSATGETGVTCIEIPWSQFTTVHGDLKLDISHEILKRVTERKS